MPLFQDISTPDFDRIREVLHRLAANPPQVLLLEGGTEPQRLAAARYWAACVNCQQPGGEGGPCLICPTCMQIDAGEHLDVLAYDGRISNADDEAHPGPIRALNMDNIRELKQKLRDAPHGQGRRVVLLMGVEQNRSNAANALLKALEEPSPSSCFVLLAAQREQLLPTLVSRSLCLTLPWPDSLSRDPALQPWEEALALFITSGRGLFERTGARNALDARLAGQILLACQKSMSRVMSGNDDALCPLDTALALLPREKRVQCCFWFNEAQEALGFPPACWRPWPPACTSPAWGTDLFPLRFLRLSRSAPWRHGRLQLPRPPVMTDIRVLCGARDAMSAFWGGRGSTRGKEALLSRQPKGPPSPSSTHLPACMSCHAKSRRPQGDSGFFNSAERPFPRKNYFQRLLYLTERPSVRSTSRLTRASISS